MKKKIDKTVLIAWLYLLGMLAFVNIMAFIGLLLVLSK